MYANAYYIPVCILVASPLASRGFAPRGDKKNKGEIRKRTREIFSKKKKKRTKDISYKNKGRRISPTKKKKKKMGEGIFLFLGGLGVSHFPRK